MRRARRGAAVAAIAVVTAVAGLISVGVGHAADPWDRAPTNDEYALLALANESRAAQNPPVNAMRWDDGLAQAARYHSWDVQTHPGCYPSHDACVGAETMSQRITRFYGNGWGSIAENIFAGWAPEVLHQGWMASAGHRTNLLNGSYRDFGASVFLDGLAQYQNGISTEDFAGPGTAVPTIPAAAVLEPSSVQRNWHVLLNYFDPLAPTRVEVVLDGAATTLVRSTGSPTNGSWRAVIDPHQTTDNFCEHAYFRVTRSDGVQFRWPQTGDIGVGYGCWNAPMGSSTPPTSTSTSTPPTTRATTTTSTTVAPNTPVVRITAPTDGAHVSTSITIRATATDDGTVKNIELYIDGRRVVRRGGGTLTRQWNAGARTVKPGQHTITVKAYDTDLPPHVGTASITVTK